MTTSESDVEGRVGFGDATYISANHSVCFSEGGDEVKICPLLDSRVFGSGVFKPTLLSGLLRKVLFQKDIEIFSRHTLPGPLVYVSSSPIWLDKMFVKIEIPRTSDHAFSLPILARISGIPGIHSQQSSGLVRTCSRVRSSRSFVHHHSQ